MPASLFQVDAFTAEPFRGNPAAVCLLTDARPDAWMQRVAQEMNLSETAFLRRRGDGFALRWFTPTDEVDLCGHATLASAHVLWTEGHLRPDDRAIFHTKSGTLRAWRDADDWIAMDFPAEPPSKTDAPPMLADALGTAPTLVGRNRMDVLALLDSADAVRALQPDMRKLEQIDARGIIVTAPAEAEGIDFVSRFFGPRVGVPEDPVTGSAHCALGPFWAERLGRTGLVGRQVSPRGGTVRVTVDAPDEGRVQLGGQAVTVLRGELVG
jgi:PhzF family phenazine biosynthesis protein